MTRETNHGCFRTTLLACLVAGSVASPVRAQATAAEVSLPAEPPVIAQASGVQATPLPAEPPKEDAAPQPVAETPAPPPEPRAKGAPPPAAPRIIPGPVTPAPRFNDLMTAVIYGDPKTVAQLLALGKWPDKPDSRGVTSLMVAAMLGDAASAEALLKAGASPNRPGPGGDTATSIARERQNAAMVSLLERFGGK
jgi:hypothetical protein